MTRKNLIAISLIQLWLGYEFLSSGWNKLVASPSFPSGLAHNLKSMAGAQAGWYSNFINHYILPHATIFGYLIEWAEVLAGPALIAAALVFLIGRKENALVYKAFAVLSILALAGIFIMSLNFYLYSGTPSPLAGQGDPYGEGVSFDFFIALTSLVLIGWNVTGLASDGKRT